MKIYTKLMEKNNAPMNIWMLYADVECQNCGKNQSFVNYKTSDGCVKCGSKINV